MENKGEYSLLLITTNKSGNQRARSIGHFLTDEQIVKLEKDWHTLSTKDRSIRSVKFGKIKTSTYQEMARRGECPPIPSAEV